MEGFNHPIKLKKLENSSESILKKVHFNGDVKIGTITLNPERELVSLRKETGEQQIKIKKLEEKIAKLELELERKDSIIQDQEITITHQKLSKIGEENMEDLEMGHIIPRLRLCLQVFENNLHEYLFESKNTMTKDKFLATLIEKLNVEKNDDALLLANYFIPPESDSIETWKVVEKIISITGPYRSFKDADFVKLKNTFETADEKKKDQFVKRLNLLTTNRNADHVT